MTEADTWGRDPQIRYMRRVFARMEKVQKEVLQGLAIEAHDDRLRRFREIALKLFEKTWMIAMQRGIAENEEDAAAIYLVCLAHALSMRGIDVPAGLLPVNQKITQFMKEVIQ